jgi:uncharacterized protein with PQ loop repeat
MEKRLASIGQLTQIILLLSPLPNFVFCHKKSLEKNSMLKNMSFKYLLSNFVNSTVWLAYSLKIENDDLIIINVIATIITSLFLLLFLYVKIKIGHFYDLVLMVAGVSPIVILPFTQYLTAPIVGLLATILSVLAYAVSLDSISMTLKTRKSETVNIAIVCGIFLNGVAWALYAIVLRDAFVLIPNFVALTSASI